MKYIISCTIDKVIGGKPTSVVLQNVSTIYTEVTPHYVTPLALFGRTVAGVVEAADVPSAEKKVLDWTKDNVRLYGVTYNLKSQVVKVERCYYDSLFDYGIQFTEKEALAKLFAEVTQDVERRLTGFMDNWIDRHTLNEYQVTVFQNGGKFTGARTSGDYKKTVPVDDSSKDIVEEETFTWDYLEGKARVSVLSRTPAAAMEAAKRYAKEHVHGYSILYTPKQGDYPEAFSCSDGYSFSTASTCNFRSDYSEWLISAWIWETSEDAAKKAVIAETEKLVKPYLKKWNVAWDLVDGTASIKNSYENAFNIEDLGKVEVKFDKKNALVTGYVIDMNIPRVTRTLESYVNSQPEKLYSVRRWHGRADCWFAGVEAKDLLRRGKLIKTLVDEVKPKAHISVDKDKGGCVTGIVLAKDRIEANNLVKEWEWENDIWFRVTAEVVWTSPSASMITCITCKSIKYSDFQTGGPRWKPVNDPFSPARDLIMDVCSRDKKSAIAEAEEAFKIVLLPNHNVAGKGVYGISWVKEPSEEPQESTSEDACGSIKEQPEDKDKLHEPIYRCYPQEFSCEYAYDKSYAGYEKSGKVILEKITEHPDPVIRVVVKDRGEKVTIYRVLDVHDLVDYTFANRMWLLASWMADFNVKEGTLEMRGLFQGDVSAGVKAGLRSDLHYIVPMSDYRSLHGAIEKAYEEFDAWLKDAKSATEKYFSQWESE